MEVFIIFILYIVMNSSIQQDNNLPVHVSNREEEKAADGEEEEDDKKEGDDGDLDIDI